MGGKRGYLDHKGRLVFRPRFDRAYSCNEGFAVVRQGDKRGFLEMDSSGRLQTYVEPRFEDVFQFTEDLAPVEVGDQCSHFAARRQPEQPPGHGPSPT